MSSPEDCFKRRNWKVEIINLPQIIKSSTARKDKGQIKYDIEKLSKCYKFGLEDAHPDVDATIILGDLSLEKVNLPKLLLLKFSTMIKSKIKNGDATRLYNHIRLISGKLGFELRRKSGTAGPVNNVTDCDMLLALKHIQASIPRKVWGSVIIRGKFTYHIFYKRCNPQPKEQEFVQVWNSQKETHVSLLVSPLVNLYTIFYTSNFQRYLRCRRKYKRNFFLRVIS